MGFMVGEVVLVVANGCLTESVLLILVQRLRTWFNRGCGTVVVCLERKEERARNLCRNIKGRTLFFVFIRYWLPFNKKAYGICGK